MIILQAAIFAVAFVIVLKIALLIHKKHQYKKLQVAINAYMYSLKIKHPNWNDRMIKKRAKFYFSSQLLKHKVITP